VGVVPKGKPKEQDFILDERKKRARKDAGAEGESATEGRSEPKPKPSVLMKEAHKEKLEKLKEVQPPKTFMMEVKEGQTVGELKKSLWSDVMRMTGVPRIASAKVLRSGKVQVTPADDQTYQALKALSAEKTDIARSDIRWPMAMFYDVDASLEDNEFVALVATQNPDLGFSVDEMNISLIPLFRRGTREGDSSYRVCKVVPSLHNKIIGKRLFVNCNLCKVVQYHDYVQCFKCLREP